MESRAKTPFERAADGARLRAYIVSSALVVPASSGVMTMGLHHLAVPFQKAVTMGLIGGSLIGLAALCGGLTLWEEYKSDRVEEEPNAVGSLQNPEMNL
jgi:hypothetical protein